jgi:hypothetical protein
MYPHAYVDDLLDYLMAPTLEHGAIAKILRDAGISHPPSATGID